MDFDNYQSEALKTAIYPKESKVIGPIDIESLISDEIPVHHSIDWVYPALGLSNEIGEVLGKLKKTIRDDKWKISEEKRQEILDEMGDVLWYWAILVQELGGSCEQIAINNLEKLKSRQERGTLSGSGDKR